jgi:hypothetical protein
MCMKTGNDLFITDLDVDSCLVNLDMETCEENWVCFPGRHWSVCHLSLSQLNQITVISSCLTAE